MTPPGKPGSLHRNGGLTCLSARDRATLLIQRCQDTQERTVEADAVMRRDPPGLGLEKSEGNSVRLLYEMCEDA